MCDSLVGFGPQRGSTRLLAHLALLDGLTAEPDPALTRAPARERVREALGAELADQVTETLTHALSLNAPQRPFVEKCW
jgi:hypothetical protein